MVKFNGFYNFSGNGTEIITGVGSETVPSYSEIINNNPKTFFSGQFTNLSMELIHINMKGVSGQSQTMHKHDIRPRESINLVNVPLGQIDVLISTTNKLGFHGMGLMWTVEDEDEYAVFASKSNIFEGESVPPTFNTDSYTRITSTAISTADIIASGTDTDFALYKLTIEASAANIVTIFWTDSSDGTIKYVGTFNFSGSGTFVLDCPEWMRNPNRQGGKLRYTTTTANSTIIDAIGHLVTAGQ